MTPKNLELAKEAKKTRVEDLDEGNLAGLQSIAEMGFFKLSKEGGKSLSLGNIKTLIEQRDEKGEVYKPSTYGTFKQRQKEGRQVRKGSVGCRLAVPIFGNKKKDKEEEKKPSNFTFKVFFAQYQTDERKIETTEKTILSPNNQ